MTICDRCSNLTLAAQRATITVMQNNSTILTKSQDLCADCQRYLKEDIEQFLKPLPKEPKITKVPYDYTDIPESKK